MNINQYSLDSLKQLISLKSCELLEDRYSSIRQHINYSNVITDNKFIICGSKARDEIRLFAQIGLVLAIVDDTLAMKWKWLFGIPVITTSEWINLIKKDPSIISILLVSTLPATRHFYKQCLQHNMNYVSTLQFLLLLEYYKIRIPYSGSFSRYGLKYLDHTIFNIDHLLTTADVFYDYFSKYSFLNLILYRLTLDPNFLDSVAVGRGLHYDYNCYLFDKTYLEFNENEVYVDAGAFTGDSIEEFLFSVRGKYKKIYAFEPSLDNCNAINSRLKNLNSLYLKDFKDSIFIINKGLWSTDTQLEFKSLNANDLGGHIAESGLLGFGENYHSQLIDVTSIDNSTDHDATFIKFEVEGSEMEALQGSIISITKNKPKLAIAIYHKPEDLLLIPNYIKNLSLNYKIGFRQHDKFKPDATYIYCT